MSRPRLTDRRGRFREIFSAVRDHHGARLPDDRPVEQSLTRRDDEPSGDRRPVRIGPPRLALHTAIVPGLVADTLQGMLSPFTFARNHLQQHGYDSSVLWVNGRASCDYNAALIAADLAERPADQQLLFIGYSKGVADVLQALVQYPSVRARTRAVVSLAGAVAGSPLADDTPPWLISLINRLPLPGLGPGDGGGIVSLKRTTRRRWLAQHRLPATVRYFSLAAVPEPDRVSRALRSSYRKLARESVRNDSQVIDDDALIPDSELLGYINADHWAATLPISKVWPVTRLLVDQNGFPREILLESIVRFVEETLLQTEPQNRPQTEETSDAV